MGIVGKVRLVECRILGNSGCSRGRTRPGPRAWRQRQAESGVWTRWQHFVARIKDFKSSFTLLCWKHRCYWVDNQAWLALYFKEYAGLRVPLIWQLPYGRGSSVSQDPYSVPPVVLWTRTRTTARHQALDSEFLFSWPSTGDCWMHCWTEEEAMFWQHTTASHEWCALPGGIWQTCSERFSIEKLVRLFLLKMASNREMKGALPVKCRAQREQSFPIYKLIISH